MLSKNSINTECSRSWTACCNQMNVAVMLTRLLHTFPQLAEHPVCMYFSKRESVNLVEQ